MTQTNAGLNRATQLARFNAAVQKTQQMARADQVIARERAGFNASDARIAAARRSSPTIAAQIEQLKLQYAAKEILNAERTGSGLKPDSTHRAPSYLSQEQLQAGKVFTIRGGDGVQRTLLQTAESGMNGKSGIFEYIVDSTGKVSHQRFIGNGAITGIPNFPIRDLPR